MKSPGYAKVIKWLSDIWRDFDSSLIARSFDYCGVVSQSDLHLPLKTMLSSQRILADYIEEDGEPEDDIEAFSTDVFEIGEGDGEDQEVVNEEADRATTTASPAVASAADASAADASPSDASPSDASPSDASPAVASVADASPTVATGPQSSWLNQLSLLPLEDQARMRVIFEAVLLSKPVPPVPTFTTTSTTVTATTITG